MASPGYLIKVSWTDNSIPASALCGVDIGVFPSAVGALNAAKTAIQTIVTAKTKNKGGNPLNFTTSVSATR